jgi:thioredoxin 1
VITNSGSPTFALDVLLSPTPVLVDFWADWCNPCKMMLPILEEISEEYGNAIKVVKVNADENSGLTAELHITSIPTLMLFIDGKEVKRITGAKPKLALLVELSEVLS